MPILSLTERLKTGSLLKQLGNEPLPDITIAEWFKQHPVSQNALDSFWIPLMLSTLSELPDYISAKAVQKVIRDGFLAGRVGMSVHLPTSPLRSIYHETTSAALAERGVSLQFFKRLRRLHWDKTNADDPPTIVALEFSDNSVEEFDHTILAMPAIQLW